MSSFAFSNQHRITCLVVALIATSTFFRCNAFATRDCTDVTSGIARSRRSKLQFLPAKKNRLPTPNLPFDNVNSLYNLRGGAESGSFLSAGLSDYSGAAQTLFANIIGPASMLTGGLVPLGFLAEPLPGNLKFHKRLRTLYFLMSVFSLANELIAIIYATVASNKLIETVVPPAASVFALIQRDYELAWTATNVHFMAGLFGFIIMVCLRAYALLPPNINKAGAGIATSFLLGMTSVVNRGIEEGNRAGGVFAKSILGLTVEYAFLLWRDVLNSRGPMAISAIALFVGSTLVAAISLKRETDD